MARHLTIVTGASRGLGHAIAVQLASDGHQLLLLSRRPPEPPVEGNARIEHWSIDLADASDVAAQLEEWLQASSPAGFESATLINNAGVVSQLAPLATLQFNDLANALRVGLEAPMLLTAAFLRATASWPVRRKVLLISSGLGRRAMAGSASYCAAKAGLDHLARAVALEESSRVNGARIVSLAPGVIDTDMQQLLRSADAALFPDRERFLGLKAAGQLDSPHRAATKVLHYLARADCGEQPVADVRDP